MAATHKQIAAVLLFLRRTRVSPRIIAAISPRLGTSRVQPRRIQKSATLTVVAGRRV